MARKKVKGEPDAPAEEPGQPGAVPDGSGKNLLRNVERGSRNACEHAGWRYHPDYRGDGTVAKLTLWLPSEEDPDVAKAKVEVYVDAKHPFLRIGVFNISADWDEIELFVNGLMGELISLLPPEARQRSAEVWQQALRDSRTKTRRKRVGKALQNTSGGIRRDGQDEPITTEAKIPVPKLDPTDIRILEIKRKDPDLKGKQIAQQLNCDSSEVSRRIGLLEKIGYIEHEVCTPAGEWYLDHHKD